MTQTQSATSERLNFDEGIAPIEFVPASLPAGEHALSSTPMDSQIVLQTIHGGDNIARRYYNSLQRLYAPSMVDQKLHTGYAAEKDWGANQVAERVAGYLNLQGYWRINTARILMDFGRLPGVTRPGATYQGRFAINYPFSYSLDYAGKKDVLENCFDPVSKALDRAAHGKHILLPLHSYDPFNPSAHYLEEGSIRPEVSLLYRSASYQEHKRLPFGQFDPLYPDRLIESTADQLLASRVSLVLQKAGVELARNYPYLLPDGCMEIRSQVFFFFDYLRDVFVAAHPELAHDSAYEGVWAMLRDTDLRSSESEMLRSYLHMYRRAPPGEEQDFMNARKAYEHIGNYLQDHRQDIIAGFLSSKNRVSTLGCEIRKDLLWQFHDKQCYQPIEGLEGARWDNINRLARLMAEALLAYTTTDTNVPAPTGPFA